MRKFLGLLAATFVGVTAVAVLGIAVALLIVDDGTDRFRSDPLAYSVANEALRMSRVHRDHPLQRLLTPAARVVAVTRLVGHCNNRAQDLVQPAGSAQPGFPALAQFPDPPREIGVHEYTALVRFYTAFGIPAGDVYLTCGGSSATSVTSLN